MRLFGGTWTREIEQDDGRFFARDVVRSKERRTSRDWSLDPRRRRGHQALDASNSGSIDRRGTAFPSSWRVRSAITSRTPGRASSSFPSGCAAHASIQAVSSNHTIPIVAKRHLLGSLPWDPAVQEGFPVRFVVRIETSVLRVVRISAPRSRLELGFKRTNPREVPPSAAPVAAGGGVHRLGRTRSRPRRIAGEETEVPRRAGSFRRAVDPWVRSDRGSPFKRSVRGVKSPRFFRVRGAGTPIGGIEGHVPSRNLRRPPLPSSSGRGAWPPRRGGSEDPRTSRLVQTDAKCRADGEEGRICEMVPHFSTNADAKAVRFPNEWHAQTKGTAPGRSRHTRRRRRRQTSQTDPRR